MSWLLEVWSSFSYRSWHGVGPNIDGALSGNVGKHCAGLEVFGGHYTSEAVLVDSVHLHAVNLQANHDCIVRGRFTPTCKWFQIPIQSREHACGD